jgi:Dolichyl-phosphate-mannose-protein mannosyltransferase
MATSGSSILDLSQAASTDQIGRSPVFSRDMTIAWILAVSAFALQMVTNGRYGYFRDELYFLATSKHLAAGYVDFAPLAAWILRLSRVLFGDSLHAIRLLPALAFAGNVLLTGLIGRELGGRRFAIFLSCTSILLAPVIVGNATRFSMNPFEPLFWMGCVLVLLRAINHNNPKLLVWCGVLIGVGLENKHSTAFFLIALLIGILATQERRFFRTRWMWIAAAIIVLLALPNLIWQYQHQFATWVDLRNVQITHKNVVLAPVPFVIEQIMVLGPVNALVWIAGLAFLFWHSSGKRYRVLGITYLAFLAMMMLLHGKDYYLAPIYPMLFAAGGLFWEILTAVYAKLRWIRIALPAAVIVLGVIALPITVPMLPVDKIVPYMERFGIKMSKTETHQAGALPQYFGDEFGWPEMVATVAGVYNSLPQEDRAKTGILAGNYGEAGAIDFFGPRYGLPKAISAHQNYYYWGPREYTGESLILLQWDLDDAQRWCQSVSEGPKLDPGYSMDEEHYTILICHHLKQPLQQVWPRFKHWN